MGLQELIRFHAGTNTGLKRGHNEDNYLVDKKLCLFMVADGMGGHAAGEIASALAVRTAHEEIKKEKAIIEDFDQGASGASRVTVKEVLNLLEYALQRACTRIHEESRKDSSKRGMGTTLSLLLVVGMRGFIAHVGDTRIYLWRDGVCRQITEDHTVHNELLKRGKLTRDQIEKVGHKHAITRALGVYERVEVDTLSFEILPGDQLLLASDGFYGYLRSEEELALLLSEPEGDVVPSDLIEVANSRGGRDNITVVLVRVGEGTQLDGERAKRLQLKREVLAGMPLFSRLSERELLRVMQVADVRPYNAGEDVIREGDRGDELFIVLSGTVRVTKGESLLTVLGRGEHFGEMALIRSVPRSATVTSDGASELIVIRRPDFFDILRTEHEMAVKLLWQFLGVLASRLDQTSRDLSIAREGSIVDISNEIFPDVDSDADTEVSPPIIEDPGDEGRPTMPVAELEIASTAPMPPSSKPPVPPSSTPPVPASSKD